MANMNASVAIKSEGENQVAAATNNTNNFTGPGTPIKQKPAPNPYLNLSPIKRDESIPDDTSLPVSALPPMPANVPPVREETLKRLSDQQLEVIMIARPPAKMAGEANSNGNGSDEKKPPKQHPMVRVNAAAGTGKTTTLLHLATRCIDLGHPNLTYVTYTRASAKDAQERMRAVLYNEHHQHCVNASTLHSCAMRLLQAELWQHGPDEEFGEEEEVKRVLLDEHAFKDLLKENWGESLNAFIAPALNHIRSNIKQDDKKANRTLDRMEKMLFEKALFYLGRTFTNFLRRNMTLDELKDRKHYYRHYYPSEYEHVLLLVRTFRFIFLMELLAESYWIMYNIRSHEVLPRFV